MHKTIISAVKSEVELVKNVTSVICFLCACPNRIKVLASRMEGLVFVTSRKEGNKRDCLIMEAYHCYKKYIQNCTNILLPRLILCGRNYWNHQCRFSKSTIHHTFLQLRNA